jgi:hypothetical protein
VGLVLFVTSVLVYLTVGHELDAAAEYARNVWFVRDADIEYYVNAYHDTSIFYALIQYVSIVFAVLGLALLTFGPWAIRGLREGGTASPRLGMEASTPDEGARAPQPTGSEGSILPQASGRLAPTSRTAQ